MQHLSLSRLSLLGGEIGVLDPEESQHLKSCEHCARLLRWFADDELSSVDMNMGVATDILVPSTSIH